jgi:hypothetical protein
MYRRKFTIDYFCVLLVGDGVKRRPRRRKLGKSIVRRRMQEMMRLSVEFSLDVTVILKQQCR